MGDAFVGLYLHGSLVLGDFAPERSDIDFIVATAERLTTDQVTRLAAFHAHLAATDNPWARRLEGSYIPTAALWRYDPAHAVHPAVRVGGQFGMDGHGSDMVLQTHVLREHGVAWAGPQPVTLVARVDAQALCAAQRATLQDWWAPQLLDPHRLLAREYQAYALLTMCRARYTLEFGRVVSKPVAAAWAKTQLDPAFHPVIDRALAWPTPPQPDDLAATLALIRATLDVARV